MGSTALLAHPRAESIVAYRAGEAVSAAQFLAEAQRLAAALPPGRHLLNACADRCRFALGLAAALLSGRVSLLPSTHTPEVISHLRQFAPDIVCLTDDADCDIELPQWRYPAEPSPPVRRAGGELQGPQIPDEQIAAIVFTSGSTGAPLPYTKSWGRLTRCVRAEAVELGLVDGRDFTLIGTVPPQHMYGFESTVLVAMQSGNAFTAERPFYPADIAAAIAAAQRPRALVTTPVHLRTLLGADLAMPAIDLMVCATAPLSREMAADAQQRFGAPLLEIYGSTETGQIAIRRTAETQAFRLWPAVRLRADNGQTYAHGGHIEQMTPLCDVIEPVGDREFILHGRTADLVNVAGKRSSFGYLNAQLNSIPGVTDGAFFLRDGPVGETGITRLAAAVVAPTLDAAAVLDGLRRRIDPVFLPRPLMLVSRLPRNSTGKVPHQALEALAAQHAAAQSAAPPASASARPMEAPEGSAFRRSLDMPADHPAFDGHFPGMPILPGAALLDAAVHLMQTEIDLDLTEWELAAAKFLEPVRPGEELSVEHAPGGADALRFTVRSAGRPVLLGTLGRRRPAGAPR